MSVNEQQIELILARTDLIESQLREGLGAKGLSLGQCVENIRDALPEDLVRTMWSIVLVRTMAVHTAELPRDLDDVLTNCESASKELATLIETRDAALFAASRAATRGSRCHL